MRVSEPAVINDKFISNSKSQSFTKSSLKSYATSNDFTTLYPFDFTMLPHLLIP